MPDKFTATWVSYSSINDFLQCPRSYYLKNVYKNPLTGHKITLASPNLSLGQAVHSVLESLSNIPKNHRFDVSLPVKFDEEWKKVSGKKGGFSDKDSEYRYKTRGIEMLKRVFNNPGPIGNLSIKMSAELPQYFLSEEKNIMLCGKIDWLEYLEEKDSVHIIDFKTGKKKDNSESLQLPIYYLLVHNCQKRKVAKVSYWYLETDNSPMEVELPSLEEAHKRVLDVAERIKLARQLEKFSCPHDGCFACKPFEKILKGEADLVGSDQYKRDIYMVRDVKTNDSRIL
ncbi:PD-(D/E)XK nuclease family protein [bacterium]|nr:MAG: PD-(D/E)XK nuclease family protein [bacterium]